MIEKKTEIVIIGGGLTGAILMLALVNKGYDCLLVDRKSMDEKIDVDFDARSLALSAASVRILEHLGIWPLLLPHATPMHTIHVSEQFRFGSARLHATTSEVGLQPLGYVVEMQPINQALHQLLDPARIIAPAELVRLEKDKGIVGLKTQDGDLQIQAQLIVGADGTDSTLRQLAGLSVVRKDYRQHAIVANIGLAKPHQYQAFERFTSSGPLALLPMTANRMSLVWAMRPEQAASTIALDDKNFLKALQKAFGYRLGRLIRVGQRHLYPLIEVTMPAQVDWPLVFVGNAAHTIHPVAGQGFNLGLRDVAALAQAIVSEGLNPAMLGAYEKQRSQDQKAIIKLTSGLVELFTHGLPGLGLARGLGLIAMDNSAFLKNYLMRYTSGFGGIIPDLVCGIELEHRSLS